MKRVLRHHINSKVFTYKMDMNMDFYNARIVNYITVVDENK